MRSRPQPKIPWRLEIALAASLLIALLAVLVVENRGSARAVAKSSTPARPGTELTNSDPASTTRRGVPKVGLVSPRGSERTTLEMRDALEHIGLTPKRLTLMNLREIDGVTPSRFDVLFLISFDDLRRDPIAGSFDLIEPLSDYVHSGGTVVASTSWSRILFTSKPFNRLAEALDYPIRLPEDYRRMRSLDYERRSIICDVKRWDPRLRDWRPYTWRFDGEWTPNLNVNKLPERGIDIWCYSTSSQPPHLPIVISKPLGDGNVFYSAIGDYNQDAGALALLRTMVEYVPPWRPTVNGRSTREKSATRP